jgi:ankyrin repeat protein
MRYRTFTCMIWMFALLLTMHLTRFSVAQVYPPGIAPRDRALLDASIGGDSERAAALLAQGANSNIAQVGGRTALHWAAANGHSKVMRLLIDHGANVNAQDDTKRTALVEAAGAQIHKASRSS